ncbi:MAG: hypothetical protein Q9210_006895 [Variospora velana]
MLLPRPDTAIAAIAAGLNLTAIAADPNNGFPFPAVLCYDRRYATDLPEFSDCAGIIANTIATESNPSVRIPFSRWPLPGIYSVPKYWVSRRGSCRVTIDVPIAPAEMASLQEIKATADAILMKCVLGEDHLGGMTMIGERGLMIVEILGFPLGGARGVATS